MRKVFPGLVALLLLSSAPTFAQQKNVTAELLAEQKRRIEAQLIKDREREAKTQSALTQAQTALANAQKANDSESATVAQRAVSIAQTALERVRALIQRDEDQLRALGLLRLSGGEGGAVSGRLRGDVFRKTKSGRAPLDPKIPMRTGDEIETGPDSNAEILFSDGSKVQLGENSIFVVTGLTESKSTFDLIKGKLHTIYECLRKSQAKIVGTGQCSSRIQTSSVVIGVRGTEYEVEILVDGSTDVSVVHGTVELTAKATKKSITLGAGQKAIVMPDGTIKSSTVVSLFRESN